MNIIRNELWVCSRARRKEKKEKKRDRGTEDVCVNGRRRQKEIYCEIVVNKLTTQEREQIKQKISAHCTLTI